MRSKARKREYDIGYRSRNAVSISEKRSDYRVRTSASNVARAKRWKQANPERHRVLKLVAEQRRRARIRASSVNDACIRAFVHRVRSSKRFPCYYCTRKFNGRTMHIDHVVSIKRNGQHDIGNMCAACPSCNQRKAAKPVSEFHPTPQQLLSL